MMERARPPLGARAHVNVAAEELIHQEFARWARSGRDVVVHHRGFVPRLGSDVRGTLLRWTRRPADPIPRRDDPLTWFQGNVPWAAAVDDVLNSAGGTTSQTFGGGWQFVGSNAAARRKSLTGQDLDNTRTGVGTFDLDLGAAPSREGVDR